MGRREVADPRPVPRRYDGPDVVDPEPSTADIDHEADQGAHHLVTETRRGYLQAHERWPTIEAPVVAPTGCQDGSDQRGLGFGARSATEGREVVGTYDPSGHLGHRRGVEWFVDPPRETGEERVGSRGAEDQVAVLTPQR